MSFAPSNGGFPGVSTGGSPLGGLAGSLASEVAGHLGPLGGLVGQLSTVQRAVQLAHTGFSLMQKTPESVAGAINGAVGGARLTQENRYVTIETPLGPDVLLVSAAVIDEYVNALPTMHLDLLSHRHDLTIDDLIGQRVKVKLDPQTRQSVLGGIVAAGSNDDDVRHFDGFVMSFDRVGNPGKVTQYQMTVVPWFWVLTRSTDCRIFQNLTVADILTKIFKENGFSDFVFELHSQYKPIEYIVMYQESYYNFCARLMEQEGLIWTHRYEKDKHILAIGDSNLLFRPMDGLKTLPYSDSQASELNGIDRLNEGRRFGVGKVTFRDFNHQNPSSPLMLVEASPQNLKHAQLADTERFEHQSLYDHSNDGDRYARFAMEAEEVQAHRYTGSGYAWRLTTGGTTAVTGHPVEANNQEYVFLHVRHEAVNDYTQQPSKLPYRNTFVCLPRKIPYRSERQTPKPVVHGTQSAIVVGPKGEQIYTNGSCVKVHFIWDRRGKMDGTDSMWIRVSQPWAGDGWGAAAIPRIGQEVSISFNQGDPDNPMIIGRVYNGDNGNPYHGAAGQTMGIKSQTHKGEGSNELRMSDVNGAQELFLHAQRDMNTVVKNDQTHTIEGGNRTIKVLKGDVIHHVGQGNLTQTVAKVHSSRATVINTKAIAGDAGAGVQSHQATDEIEHRVGASVVTMKPDSIRISHGASSILINQSGVFIDAPVIHLNQGLFVTPEQAVAIQWAQQQAIIAAGLASPDPKVQAAARELQKTVKAQQMAKLAGAVYAPGTAPPGWKNISNDPEALKKYGLTPKDFHIPGSNFGAQMYAPDPAVFGDSLKPTVAFKGTESLNPMGDDMQNNLAQGMNANSPYYAQAVNIGTKIQDSGNASAIDLTGHSLGGGEASAAAEASGSSATLFNAAGLNSGTLTRYGAVAQPAAITNYRVDGDVLTGLQEGTLGAAGTPDGAVLAPVSEVTGMVMPKAVGEQIAIPGSSLLSVDRHKIPDVLNGMDSRVADQQSSLLSQLGGQ